MSNEPHGRKLLALGVAGSLVLAACSDDPVDVHVDEDIGSVELVISGVTVATWDVDAQSWTGQLDVDVRASSGGTCTESRWARPR